MMNQTQKTNRLIHAASPYLLQHAYNPVEWYEWSEEALTKAKQENKPILVSIGYSSCHWCHVMEREVFEKDDIARIMNNHLVCIKVDREERPDIDHIYMEAVQAMGVNGGWPLNVFLTPDQKPFYGGTYYPPDQWVQVVQGIHNAFSNRRNEIESSAKEITDLLSQQDVTRYKKNTTSTELKNDLETIYNKLQPAFDKTWGGLEKEPKFIMPSIWLWLLRYYHLTRNEKSLEQIMITLKKIAMGGIYDQIGGGFSRYSVDKFWFIPHFEKMLYDNAQLMSLYAEAYALTKDEEFKTVILETFEWLQTEMMNVNGGFYAALDADSEGVEGKFYSWTSDQIKEILGADAEFFMDYYSVKENGNWEHQKNILMRVQKEETFLKKHHLTKEVWHQKLITAKTKLLTVRDKRVKPGLDDKVITGWNAMMVAGLTDAYKALGDENFLKAAIRNMKFIEKELTEGQILFRSFKNKRSLVKGFLDDYAYVIQACLRLYQVTFDEYWIDKAKDLMQHTIDHFYDAKDGFFQYTRQDAEKLIASRKEIFDNVIPSSNSVMAQNLFYLGIFFDNQEWKKLSENMVFSLSHLITSEPNYMSNWGIVFTEMKKGMAEVAFVGSDARMSNMEFHTTYQPFVLTMGSETKSQLPLLEDKTPGDGELTIYVCYNRTCQKPVLTIEEAAQQLKIIV